ncbi:MAG: ribose 5-phosphate isomerase B [Oscillospiraceae bacterium]
MIAIASDHGGLSLKKAIMQYLKTKNIEYSDLGTYTEESCDYPDYAAKVCRSVIGEESEKGILVCGTGIGMSLAANKFKGIRAAVCGDCFSAKYTRMHNDANILCLGERVTGEGLALEIVELFLNTDFEGGRHARRLAKLTEIENGSFLYMGQKVKK